ncbi:MAG: hypothetical protein RL336_826 [Pseudomonadota bacterium]
MHLDNVTPLECMYHWEQHTPNDIYLRQANKLEWQEFTWAEVADRVRRTASFILGLDLPRGSRIALWSANSMDWVIVDLAIMLSGHVSVPLYPGQDIKSANYILDHAECSLMFLGVVDQHAAIANGDITREMPTVAMLGCQVECTDKLSNIIATFEPYQPSPVPDDNDMMTILYTSGTTGNPKGVVHVHGTPGKVVPRMIDAWKLGLDGDRERYFSFLPMSHAAERIVVEMGSFYLSPTVSFSEGLETFGDELRSVQPTLFFAVPRLWAKFKAGVDAKVPADVQAHMNDEQRAQVRAMLGLAKAKFVITGSAPTPVDIQEWFISMGINLRDGYGMTENFIDGCIFNGDEPIPGCVGKTFKGSEVRISEDGEICFRGAGLMQGYYKNPEKTAEVLIDGWYHTGDSGRIDENGNLWVTGRLGEVFKTTKGKFVQPPELENRFGGVSLLAQLLIFGHGKDQPLLLTNLSEVAHASGKDQAAISAELEAALEQINSQLPPYEKIPQIFITKEDWRIDNGLLTPTMKLKRRQIEEHYSDLINGNLGGATIVWE